MKRLPFLFALPAMLLFLTNCSQSPESQSIDLSGLNWKIWLDREAEWEDDSLYLPPVDVSILPVNPPTCGWETLYTLPGQEKATLPATVEEYYWDRHSNTTGVSGNYKGVSWFHTDLHIPESFEEKYLYLEFERVRLRAEVFLNEQLVGYDLINGTPFRVDITGAARAGETNRLAVRITDPNGNFTWRDYYAYRWGEYYLTASHGFGGITGPVKLVARDHVMIDDVFIKNKPDLTSVDLDITLLNREEENTPGSLEIGILKDGELLEDTVFHIVSRPGVTTERVTLTYPDADPWSPDQPFLYTLRVDFRAEDGEAADRYRDRFGFRWFDIEDRPDGDRQLVLNGKRIVLRSAISWGFWPVNGIYPTPELQKRQISVARKFGLNMLNFHRGIGQTPLLELADEMGLLIHEEPGGYRAVHAEDDPFTIAFKKERLMRMIRRDRNHPSVIMYNMINEAALDPSETDMVIMQEAHNLDETRLITYSSNYFPEHYYGGEAPEDTALCKLYMEPYEHEQRLFGWFDEHHAGSRGVYTDDLYNDPDTYWLHTDHAKEVIFWGEEGAIGTPPDLQSIHEELAHAPRYGWDGQHYLDMYEGYRQFLEEKGFTEAFPSVQSLTHSLGKVSLYHQARRIENIRINNLADGYVVNGWESMKIENHSGIVDSWRNPKSDPSILAYYNQPLYVAVKLRDKVTRNGDTLVADFHLVNEKGLKGEAVLKVRRRKPGGILEWLDFPVSIQGGNRYGQLLKAGVPVPVQEGYNTVYAELIQGDSVVAEGMDRAYAVAMRPFTRSPEVSLNAESKSLIPVLREAGLTGMKMVKPGEQPGGGVFVTGPFNPETMEHDGLTSPLLEWIMNGNTMIILDGAAGWARYLSDKEVIDFRGSEKIGAVWYGGNYFVRSHPLFSGLPVNTAFDWEYQSLAVYGLERDGLRIRGDSCIVGVQKDHQPELYSAVSIIPAGNGQIILSALDLEKAINSGGKPSATAVRILQNYLHYSTERMK